jgi:membrane protease subunit HflC
MNAKSIALGIVALLTFITLSSSVYIVLEYERAVVLRFGKLQPVYPTIGINFKIPFADKVRKFDGRILTLDAPPESYFTVQNKRLVVDSYAKWRIEDVGEYYRATGGSETVASSRLAVRINDGLRNEVGQRTLHEVVSGERDQLMVDLTKSIDSTVGGQLGIKLVDIRVKRIDLPDDVRDSVYRRMAADREKEAREYRSKGKEQAEIIEADADRQRTVIEAEAYRDSELLRGEGDAKAASIYAAAYNDDPELYSFVRSLNAYKSAFSSKSDIMLIGPDSNFFRFLKDAQGREKIK